MTMPFDLVLVRHGESEGNVANRRSRRGDDSHFTEEFLKRHSSSWRLTEKGRTQATTAGAWIRENIAPTFDRCYTSEYLRAMETAALLGLEHVRWYPEFYLRERDWGVLDVMSQTQRIEEHAEALKRREADPLFWTPPNGQSMADLCLRVDRVIDTMHRECADKSVVIVCHGETMLAFRVRLERMRHERFRELCASRDPHDQIGNCQVLHYTRREPGRSTLAAHLDWMRSVNPTDPTLSSNEWQRIERRSLVNDDLLAYVERMRPSDP
jgi:NAD+ kinase